MANNVYNFPTTRSPRPGLGKGLSGDGGGSTFNPMERRVARLEEDMREIKTDLKAQREEIRSGFKDLRSDIGQLAVEVAEIKGRVSHLPTVWQINLQMIGMIFTVMGGAFLILKYGLQ